jgi:hypothetical protein
MRLVPDSIIQKYNVLPVAVKDNKIYISLSDPISCLPVLDEIKKYLEGSGYSPCPVLALKSEIEDAINSHFHKLDNENDHQMSQWELKHNSADSE